MSEAFSIAAVAGAFAIIDEGISWGYWCNWGWVNGSGFDWVGGC